MHPVYVPAASAMTTGKKMLPAASLLVLHAPRPSRQVPTVDSSTPRTLVHLNPMATDQCLLLTLFPLSTPISLSTLWHLLSLLLSSSTASSVPMVYQQTFRDLNASSSANSYIGLYALQSYDVAKCAAICDKVSLCTAFNIYIERDPSQNPTNNDSTAPTVWGYDCPNPASMTSYRCTIWGSPLSASTATNSGGYRSQFQVAITASNGYDKTAGSTPSTPIGNSTNSSPWSNGRNCGHKAINSPQNWMGSRFFLGPFNPQLCGNFAIAQNFQNKATAKSAGKNYYQPCNMFNAYYLHKNGLPWGTYCALYDIDLVVSYATYAGATLVGDVFEVAQSFTWTLLTGDKGYF
ncbi:hypothetical protein D6D01_05396 [Aureobasidium pullulans]|uniref:Apple domain-containing protein n=1 Tax=Aureobasidium pullulans TaxID=5580 RepID=A0A4S9L7D5_AURPU|nr:hypothetical protein D6D01_05396 [Aureobasidium pullulans]